MKLLEGIFMLGKTIILFFFVILLVAVCDAFGGTPMSWLFHKIFG